MRNNSRDAAFSDIFGNRRVGHDSCVITVNTAPASCVNSDSTLVDSLRSENEKLRNQSDALRKTDLRISTNEVKIRPHNLQLQNIEGASSSSNQYDFVESPGCLLHHRNSAFNAQRKYLSNHYSHPSLEQITPWPTSTSYSEKIYRPDFGSHHAGAYGNSIRVTPIDYYEEYIYTNEYHYDYANCQYTEDTHVYPKSPPLRSGFPNTSKLGRNDVRSHKSRISDVSHLENTGTLSNCYDVQSRDKQIAYSAYTNSRKSKSISSPHRKSKKRPIVYPALLSEVAQAFMRHIHTENKIKDGLTYKKAFLGCEAIDIIMYIIRTSDRNLALLLGRALDAQKFIHDVTYDHRLRDSSVEVYQFREIMSPHILDPLPNAEVYEGNVQKNIEDSSPETKKRSDLDIYDLPVGIFTLLTECYSPTCTRDKLCYSTACPRRLEQQTRLNLTIQPTLRRDSSRGSLFGFEDTNKEQKLWIHTVPENIAVTVDEKEKKRQEIICELIYTERDFVKDIEYLHDFWIKPLRISPVVPESRREKFIRIVFGNVMEIYNVNSRLAEALTKRQRQNSIVSNVGNIFLEYVPHFEPFIRYGAGQLYGKFEFERERNSNSEFAKFVDETERMKESRKLELNGYLTKPTTRLARYPLLLGAILKSTNEESRDFTDIPKVINMIKEFLNKVNIESGRAENRFNLFQLNRRLQFKPGEYFNMHLLDGKRELIFKGSLNRRRVGGNSSDLSNELQIFLFDHALLIVKVKLIAKLEQYRVYKKPIPLELLILSQYEENLYMKNSPMKRNSASVLPETVKSSIVSAHTIKEMTNSKGYPLTFTHLGRRGYSLTLYATTYVGRKKWVEHIEKQKMLLREKNSVFNNVAICSNTFAGENKLNCLAAFGGGRKLVFGTNNGLFVADRKPRSDQKAKPEKVLSISNATQVDVIEEYGILLVLSDKVLYSFNLEILDPYDSITIKKGRKITGHISFFEAGVCLGRVLVCAVKSSVLSTTIKVLEPVDHLTKPKKQVTFKRILAGGPDQFKVYKELYMPTESTSVHFLKTKLCVGCAKGFEIVNLTTLERQSMLDPADTSLDFVEKRENVKPIAIFRMNGDFLLCYSEFALYVNKHGWRTRPDWFVSWEGVPTKFALSYPYILAFEPSFVEIRHIEKASLVQIISGNNIRLLSDGRGTIGEGGEILYACNENINLDVGEDCVVYSLENPNDARRQPVSNVAQAVSHPIEPLKRQT